MNERIKELSEQAQLYARQGMGKCVIELKRFDKDAVSERYAKDFEEKFAELIVRECAGVAEVSMPINSHPDDRLTVKNNVLKHFGVEE